MNKLSWAGNKSKHSGYKSFLTFRFIYIEHVQLSWFQPFGITFMGLLVAILLSRLMSSKFVGRVESTALSFIFVTNMFLTSSYLTFDSSQVSFRVCKILASCTSEFVSFDSRGVSTVQIKLEEELFKLEFFTSLSAAFFLKVLFSFIWSVKSTSFFKFLSNAWMCSSDVLIRLF